MISGMYEGTFAKLNMVFQDRINDSCFLYLRFDKQSAYSGELILTELGDAIHLRFKVLSFPAEREVAISKIKNFLGAQGKHEA